MNIISVDLNARAQDLGPLRLICAEWWEETPHFVLLKYALYGREQDDYLRLDLDKRAIVDDIDDYGILKETLWRKSQDIWAIVVAEQQRLAVET